jgi:membrane protease YdiL (CAAX protease family)
VYLALAFGLSWTVQIGLSLGTAGGVALTSLGGGLLVTALFLMWPPAIAAYVARRWIERSGFDDAGLRWPDWRFLLLSWLGPPVLTLLALLVSLPLYPFDPTFAGLRALAVQAGQSLPVEPELIVLAQVVLGLTLAVPLNSFFAFGEEFGWRGYLLLRLVRLLGPGPGLLAHGAIWGFWHAPLIFLTGYNYPTQPALGVLLFIVFGTLAGVLLGWLQLASNSVVPPTVAHASLNAIAGLPFLLLRGVDPAIAGVLHSPLGWLVLLVAIAWLVQSGVLSRALESVR